MQRYRRFLHTQRKRPKPPCASGAKSASIATVGEVAAVTVDRRIELPLHRPQPRFLVDRAPAPLGVLAGLYARHDWPAAGTQIRTCDRLPTAGATGCAGRPMGVAYHRWSLRHCHLAAPSVSRESGGWIGIESIDPSGICSPYCCRFGPILAGSDCVGSRRAERLPRHAGSEDQGTSW